MQDETTSASVETLRAECQALRAQCETLRAERDRVQDESSRKVQEALLALAEERRRREADGQRHAQTISQMKRALQGRSGRASTTSGNVTASATRLPIGRHEHDQSGGSSVAALVLAGPRLLAAVIAGSVRRAIGAVALGLAWVRVTWRARRRRRLHGRPAIALVTASAMPASAVPPLLAELRHLSEAGTDPCLLARTHVPIALRERPWRRWRRRAARRARRQFEATAPDAAAKVVQWLGDGSPLATDAFALAALARDLEIVYLHARGAGDAATLARAASWLLGISYGISTCSEDSDDATRSTDAPAPPVLTDAALVTAPDTATAQHLLAAAGGALPHLVVTPPPIYAEPAAPDAKRTAIAILGSVDDDAATALAEACAQVVAGGNAVSLLPLDPDVGRRMRRALSQRGADVRVLAAAEPTRGLRRAIACVCLDRETTLESPLLARALGMALPVIVPRGPHTPVVDGTDGFVVPANDARGIARVLARLISDSQLRGELGRAARARYDAELGPTATGKGCRARLREVLALPPRRGSGVYRARR